MPADLGVRSGQAAVATTALLSGWSVAESWWLQVSGTPNDATVRDLLEQAL